MVWLDEVHLPVALLDIIKNSGRLYWNKFIRMDLLGSLASCMGLGPTASHCRYMLNTKAAVK
jgi:hypothetical protein